MAYLPKPNHQREANTLGTVNISLPDSLRSFVEEQVATGGYGTSSEYLRELIRHDRERAQMRALLLNGGSVN